jgi:hypothetical protein
MPTKKSKTTSPGVRGKPMKKGVRSPTAHRTLEQAQKTAEPGGYQASKKRKKYRADLGKLPSAGEGRDKGHKKAFSKGGSTKKSNIKSVSRSKNRGHGMTRGAKANKGK